MPSPVVAVAVSGGLDSLAAARILQGRGMTVFGIHFTTGYESDPVDVPLLASRLGMDVVVADLSVPFEDTVVRYVVDVCGQGNTPNPCLICNREIKFGALLAKARSLGADCLATGHYARIINRFSCPDHNDTEVCLKKGRDTAKDQSYFLARVPREHLSRVLFPLGDLTKDQVRALAAREGWHPVTHRESQDVCFIPRNGFHRFVREKCNIPAPRGPIVDKAGRQVGTHDGLAGYTIGQRRGITCPAAHPYYVRRIDMAANTLHVCFKSDMYQDETTVTDLLFYQDLPSPCEYLTTRIRYRHPDVPAILTCHGTRGHVRFRQPQFAVTPGQAAVFYHGERVLGSGIIQ